MRTFKILLLLVVLSLQANATGYVHNMFVAHKKLQSKKETTEVRNACSAPKHKHIAQVRQAGVKMRLTNQAPATTTLNERVLQEGPLAFFSYQKEEESDSTMIARVVNMMRCVVQTFIPTLRNS